MRNVINTTANVTTNAIVNRTVRTVLAGVDAMRDSSAHHVRLYAAPAPMGWAKFAGKQKPGKQGPMPGGSDLDSRCSRRESSRCRRPRVSSCLRRS